jgi:hypothetical protein
MPPGAPRPSPWLAVRYRKLQMHALAIFGAVIAFPALLAALPQLQVRSSSPILTMCGLTARPEPH